MVNTELLEDARKKSGKTWTHIANALGISVQALRLKRKGILDFKASEIKILCAELGISLSEMRKIFNLV